MLGFHSKKRPQNLTRRELARSRREQDEKRSSEQRKTSNMTFQRSRTITGSISSRVRGLGEEAAHMQSPRVRAHHLTRLRRHIGVWLIGSLITIAVLFVLVSQLTADVDITIDGDASITAQADYQQSIQKYFSQAPFERLRFFTNDANLTKHLKAAHPEVRSVVVDGSSGVGRSHVSIEMRRPAVEWSINGVVNYVDANGISFATNYYTEPKVKVIDKSGVRLSPGQTLFSDAFLSFVGRVVGAAKQLEHVTVTKIVIPPRTTHQIEVYVAGVKYPTKFAVDRGAGAQVEDMARTQRWLHHRGITPKYVDVRVSGEAYYK